MSGANGEITELLLLPSVLGADCGEKKLDMGVSLLSKEPSVLLDSSACVAFAGGKKLNLGSSLLSKGLGAAWLANLELRSDTGADLVCICVELGLPKVVAAEKGLELSGAVDVVGFGAKGVAAGLSWGIFPLTSRFFSGLPDADLDDVLSSSDSPTKRDSLFSTEAVSASEGTSMNPCDCA